MFIGKLSLWVVTAEITRGIETHFSQTEAGDVKLNSKASYKEGRKAVSLGD